MRLVLIAATAAAALLTATPAFAQTASEAAAIEEFKRGQASADAKKNDETITIMTGVIQAGKLPKEWQPYPYFYRGQAYRRLEKYVEALADFDKAIELKPDLAPAFFESGMAYHAQEKYKQAIATLDGELKTAFNAIAKEKRKVVTTHDAFGYFSRAYGIAFISPVGINTDAEASAADIGRIIKQIRREKIPAVFMENISDPRLLERIRQESGAKIGGVLYSDSLSKADGPAATYLAMMRHNAKTLASALAN